MSIHLCWGWYGVGIGWVYTPPYQSNSPDDAERKCGELLAQTEKAKGGEHFKKTTGNTDEPVVEKPKTLEEMGLTKKQSSNYQKLANVPEEKHQPNKIDNTQVENQVLSRFIVVISHSGQRRLNIEQYRPFR